MASFFSLITGRFDSKIAELRQKIEPLEAQKANALARAHALITDGEQRAEQLGAYFTPRIALNTEQIHTWVYQCSLASAASWSHQAWSAWEGESTPAVLLRHLRYAEMTEQRADVQCVLPAYAPFIGQNRTIIIRSGRGLAAQGKALLQSLVMRTALMLPHQTGYTLLDPASLGSAFPMQGSLPNEQINGDDVARDLTPIIEDIQRIKRDYLSASVQSFDQLPDDARMLERYHLIFAADFPDGYDRRTIEALQRIANSGPQAGRYLFLHYNEEFELPRDVTLDDFKNAFYMDVSNPQATGSLDATLKFDQAPPAALQTTLLNTLKRIKPVDRAIDWDEVAGLEESRWWTGDSSWYVEAPIGKRANGETLGLWIGEKGTRPCVHGVLGGSAGYGKSRMLQNLLLSLAVRYSPADLQFYLMDGKYGNGFLPFIQLPHAKVVSLYTQEEVSRSLLEDLVEELERRSQILNHYDVQSFPAYCAKGSPGGKLPRIIVFADEYQWFFEDDTEGHASDRLAKLSAQGRFVGIHLLLCSQGFDVPGMLRRDVIFRNIQLRMAMAMPKDSVRALTEFDAHGKLLIENATMTGQIVVSELGSETPNLAGRTALISDERISELLRQMQQKALHAFGEHTPLIFNGEEQPPLIHNPHLAHLLQRSTYLSSEELQRYARTSIAEGGLGINDWYASQQPAVAWLGQEFNVHGHAKVILRRRVQEHILVVGNNNAVRYGMLAATLVSLAVTSHPERARFMVIDKSIPESEWGPTLQHVCEKVLRSAGFSTGFTRKDAVALNMIEMLAKTLDERRAMETDLRAAQPAIFIVMTELENIDAILRIAGMYDQEESPYGTLLKRLIAEGSALGMHLILSFDCVGALKQVLDIRRDLDFCRHRVALQMGEDDAFDLVRSRKAAQLGTDKPIRALYFDIQSNAILQFMPYTIEPPRTRVKTSSWPTFEEQIQTIGSTLASR